MKKIIVMTEQEYWDRIVYLKENGPEFGVKVRVFCYKIAKKIHAEKLFRKLFCRVTYILHYE